MPSSSQPAVRRKPFVLREPFNGFSHLAGVLLSVIALVVLMSLSQGRLPALVGCGLFGVSLVLVYVASTLYHSLHVSRRIYDWLGRFDYIAIFLLIAGTFAPLCLVTLHGRVGSSVLIAEYSLALIGILGVLVWKKMPDWVRIGLYVAMSLLMVPLLPLLRTLLPAEAIGWLVGGGIVYLIGLVIFAFDRPRLWPGRNLAHGIWHLFVLGGSACHFVAVLRFIALPIS